MLRARVLAGLDRVRQQGKKLGRPKVSPKIENAIRNHLSAGNGILKVAALVGVGSGTVQRVKREMAGELAQAACCSPSSRPVRPTVVVGHAHRISLPSRSTSQPLAFVRNARMSLLNLRWITASSTRRSSASATSRGAHLP
jgi:hypothetical protein